MWSGVTLDLRISSATTWMLMRPRRAADRSRLNTSSGGRSSRSIRTPFACSITIREASAARSCAFSSSRDASLSSSSVDMTSLSCPRVERLRDVRADPELLHDQIPVVGLHDLFDVGELVSVKHEETVRARTYLLVLVACQRHGLVALRLKAFADELG